MAAVLTSSDLSQRRLCLMGTKGCHYLLSATCSQQLCKLNILNGLRGEWLLCCAQPGLNCRQMLCCQSPKSWLRG